MVFPYKQVDDLSEGFEANDLHLHWMMVVMVVKRQTYAVTEAFPSHFRIYAHQPVIQRAAEVSVILLRKKANTFLNIVRVNDLKSSGGRSKFQRKNSRAEEWGRGRAKTTGGANISCKRTCLKLSKNNLPGTRAMETSPRNIALILFSICRSGAGPLPCDSLSGSSSSSIAGANSRRGVDIMSV